MYRAAQLRGPLVICGSRSRNDRDGCCFPSCRNRPATYVPRKALVSASTSSCDCFAFVILPASSSTHLTIRRCSGKGGRAILIAKKRSSLRRTRFVVPSLALLHRSTNPSVLLSHFK